jgi:SulP family sulfate permease
MLKSLRHRARADFLSQTVLVGFLTGVGFQVGIAMLGEMLGVAVT